ncbi:MAG: hypothetical protein ACXAC2_23440 [Candidatus Kariarchaeaceae archaeon]
MLSPPAAIAQQTSECTDWTPCHHPGSPLSVDDNFTWDLSGLNIDSSMGVNLTQVTTINLTIVQPFKGLLPDSIMPLEDFFIIEVTGLDSENQSKTSTDSSYLNIFLDDRMFFNLIYPNAILDRGRVENYFELITINEPVASSSYGAPKFILSNTITREIQNETYVEFASSRFEQTLTDGSTTVSQVDIRLEINTSSGLLISGSSDHLIDGSLKETTMIAPTTEIDELPTLIEELDVDLVIFDNPLAVVTIVAVIISVIIVIFYYGVKRKS